MKIKNIEVEINDEVLLEDLFETMDKSSFIDFLTSDYFTDAVKLWLNKFDIDVLRILLNSHQLSVEDEEKIKEISKKIVHERL